MDDQWGQTWSLELCAWIIAARLNSADNAQQEAQRAAWLLGAARARQRKVGVSLGGMRPLADRHAHAHTLIAAWLSDEQISAQMEAGSRGHGQAVRIALGEPTTRRVTAAGPEGLTDREREVARLVAEGLTSAEIGAQLRIGHRTVDVHVRNIMRKLGVRRRVAIATWVAAQPDSSYPTS
ncbi:helix-turn-helix transcriptional regulator [Actinoplanes sp. NPDC051475]|uniref:helix-turn-helix transcriptional regulator n=1 Tax=Actinoplanes sp. NPDC051475 TaxID=3157225 RepID=UPI003450F57E